jgi:transposase-like protein
MNLIDKKDLKNYLKENNIKDQSDFNSLVGKLSKQIIETMLEAEMDLHLGYVKHEVSEKENKNSRNGHSSKKIQGKDGKLELAIPRDRNSDFEPKILPKHSRLLSSNEDLILSLYSKGLSVRDIQDHLMDLYNFEFSTEAISHITNKVMEKAREWQNRPLESIYSMVFIDGVVFKVRWEGEVKNISVYGMIGISTSGVKECLGLWILESESSRQWLGIFNEIKNRGVEDILIMSVDGLTGIETAIASAFPKAEVQGCIVHQVRNSLRYVSYKDYKAVTSDLKSIYKANSELEAEENLKVFEEKWDKKYPYIAKSWTTNWNKLSTFFKYSPEIRRMIYTTNPIESFNRQLRKTTKNKCSFPTSEALFKSLYLTVQSATKKWTSPLWNWSQIYGQLLVFFGDRLLGKNR